MPATATATANATDGTTAARPGRPPRRVTSRFLAAARPNLPTEVFTDPDDDDGAFDRRLARLRALADDRAAILAELDDAYAADDDADVTAEQALAAVLLDRSGDAGLEALARVLAGPADAGRVPFARLDRQRGRCGALAESLLEAAGDANGPDDLIANVREALEGSPSLASGRPARMLGADAAEAAGTLLRLCGSAGAEG